MCEHLGYNQVLSITLSGQPWTTLGSRDVPLKIFVRLKLENTCMSLSLFSFYLLVIPSSSFFFFKETGIFLRQVFSVWRWLSESHEAVYHVVLTCVGSFVAEAGNLLRVKLDALGKVTPPVNSSHLSGWLELTLSLTHRFFRSARPLPVNSPLALRGRRRAPFGAGHAHG